MKQTSKEEIKAISKILDAQPKKIKSIGYMNTKQQKDLNLTLALSVQMQSMLHTLDKLSHEPIYKREFKQRCDNFYSWLEKIVEPMTETLHEDSVQRWVDIVNELDKIVDKIKLFDE